LTDCEFALPAGVGGVGHGEALEDGEVFAESGQRLVEVALLPVDVADFGISDCEFALPAVNSWRAKASAWRTSGRPPSENSRSSASHSFAAVGWSVAKRW
jgi:hypothetical protein